MAEVTQFYRGALTVSEVMATKPASVPRGTTLLEAANILTRNRYRYVLVINNDGRLAGVISNSDLLQQVAESAETDAETWKSKTVDSVMNTKFVASSPDADPEDITPLIATSSLECIPVLEGDRLLGVLTPDDLLVSWSRVDPTLREATIDTVTHLPNRAIFNRRLEEEWERARRQLSSLSVILVDIDYFKEINDACGHLTGDAVLHMIGSCLARHLRMYDVLARFGGDEFAAICYDCDSENIDVPIGRLQLARSATCPFRRTSGVEA